MIFGAGVIGSVYALRFATETKAMGEMPDDEMISRYRQMLTNDFIIDVKLGNHAVSQKAEIMLLDEMFHKKLSNRT